MEFQDCESEQDSLPPNSDDLFESRLSGSYYRKASEEVPFRKTKRQRLDSISNESKILRIEREQSGFASTGMFLFAFVLGLVCCTGYLGA